MPNEHYNIGRLEGKMDSVLTMISEVKGDVTSLRNDFGTMEKGRLTALEVKFATLTTEITTKAKNMAIYVGIAVSIVSSVVSAVVISAIT